VSHPHRAATAAHSATAVTTTAAATHTTAAHSATAVTTTAAATTATTTAATTAAVTCHGGRAEAQCRN
jgi:hypothetical protein